MQKCCKCSQPIEPARVELNLRICFKCAEQHVQKVKGLTVVTHKTGSTIQVMQADDFKEIKKYIPHGRNTGRGSGVHRMSRPVATLK